MELEHHDQQQGTLQRLDRFFNAVVSAQGQLAEAQKLSTSQAEQIATLREELHGSLAECDQLEARLQDKEQAVAGLQQQVQAGHRQQAAVHEQLLASNGREGRLQGEVSTLSRCVPALVGVCVCLPRCLHVCCW